MNLGAKNAAQSGVLQTAMNPRSMRGPQTDRTRDVHRFTPTDGENDPAKLDPKQQTGKTRGQQPTQGQPKTRKKMVRRRRIRRTNTARIDRSRRTTRKAEVEHAAKARAASSPDEQSGQKALDSQASLTRASVGFEQNNGEEQQLSSGGQRKNMLNNLAKMSKLNYVDLHTGDDSFAYPRREGRMIVMALAGLQAGGAKQQAKKSEGDDGTTRNDPVDQEMGDGEFSLKKSVLAKVTAIFDPPPTPPPGHRPVELVA